jgi:site-specific recombinase XerD
MKNTKIIHFPKNDKKDENGKVPVYCKLKVNGTVTTFPTQKYVDPKKWAANKQFRLSRELAEKQVRSYLDTMIRDIETIEEQFQKEGKAYTAQMLKNRLLGRGEIDKNKSLFQVWELHKQYFTNQAKMGQLKPDSYKKYNSVKAKLETFLKEKYQLTDIPVMLLDDKFLKGFHLYLSGKISHNIAIKYIILFKCVVRFAADNRFLDRYPFIDYKMKLELKEKTYLTESEINNIAKKDFGTERLNLVRDCFLFSCYTAYCFADISALSSNNLFKVGTDVLVFKNREKTKVQAKVKLIAPALALVEKYSNHIDCIISGKLFPMKSNQKMNEYLKDIAALCNINKNLTWHVARFSFAKIAMENGMDIKVLSEALGHSKLAQTIHYCGQFSNTSVIREMAKLDSVFA